MITTERNVYTGAHLTPDVKRRLKKQATRRGKSVSEMISDVIELWLPHAEKEVLPEVRSNKRNSEEDVPLPLED